MQIGILSLCLPWSIVNQANHRGFVHFLQKSTSKALLLNEAMGILTGHAQVGHQVVLLQIQVLEQNALP